MHVLKKDLPDHRKVAQCYSHVKLDNNCRKTTVNASFGITEMPVQQLFGIDHVSLAAFTNAVYHLLNVLHIFIILCYNKTVICLSVRHTIL